MIYWSERQNRLIGKCDACGITIAGYEQSTDRCDFTCGFFKKAGWMQKRIKGKWVAFCPDCKKAYYETERQKYFNKTEQENGT